MQTGHPAPHSAHHLAQALAALIGGVIALMARAFCRTPRLSLQVLPYITRLHRAAQRFTILMARIAAGTPTRSRPSRPRAPRPAAKRDRLPSRRAWLLHAMRDHPERHNAAALGTQLETLLAQPGIADLLAAHPSAQRILNPIRHFLGLPTTRKPRAKPAPRAARPRRPKPPRPRTWTQILADDQALHPRPALKNRS